MRRRWTPAESLRWLRFVVLRRTRREIDEELEFHLEQAIAANQASGMSGREARRRALVEFGGIERMREETWRLRPGWLVETIGQDVRYALRGFWRAPGFTLTVIATLALGIGATTAVFSVVDRILFRALPYAHGDRMVSVGLTAPILPEEFMLGGSYYVWRDNQKPFESLTSETGVVPCDLTERNPARLSCASVEDSFLRTLGIAPVLGRDFLPEEDRPNGPKAALITYGLWRGHYGADRGILDRQIDIDGTKTRVIGVLPKEFEMPTLEAADVLLPQGLDQAAQRKADPGRVMYAFARLRPGIAPAQAQAALEPLFAYSLRLVPPGFRSEVHLRVRTLRERQMHGVRLTAWVLFGAVVAVLLIACGNVSSLMLARSMARERELAVRCALGASRKRLLGQTLTEALLLSLMGAASGWVVAEALLHLFLAIAPASVPVGGLGLELAALDLRIAAFTAGLAILCGLLFGSLAALQRPGVLALDARSGSCGGRALLRRVLVAAQIAMSMILLTASSLLVRSLWNLQHQDLGMQTHSIMTASVALGRERYATAQQQMQFFLDARAALRRLPGVTAVALTDSLPPAGAHRESIFSRLTVAGKPQTDTRTGGMVAWRWVTAEYFRVLGIPIDRGPGFGEEESGSTQYSMILSRLLADRLFPGQDPIGQRIRPSPGDREYTVVGVAANVKNSGLNGSDEPEYYRLRRNLPEDWSESSVLILATSSPAASLGPWIRSQIADIDPTVPVELGTLTERVSRLADGLRFQAVLLSFFALTGLGMAVVGLYGLTVFLAHLRTREIGIRMALGASRVDILRVVAREGVYLLLVGGGIGFVVSLLLTRVLASMLFSIGPHDPVTLLGVGLLLAGVALLATVIPARAAMRVDPVIALRAE